MMVKGNIFTLFQCCRCVIFKFCGDAYWLLVVFSDLLVVVTYNIVLVIKPLFLYMSF